MPRPVAPDLHQANHEHWVVVGIDPRSGNGSCRRISCRAVSTTAPLRTRIGALSLQPVAMSVATRVQRNGPCIRPPQLATRSLLPIEQRPSGHSRSPPLGELLQGSRRTGVPQTVSIAGSQAALARSARAASLIPMPQPVPVVVIA